MVARRAPLDAMDSEATVITADKKARSDNSAMFATRVVLENYKSIAACDVSLAPLTFLVGPNGSGKSNFLDALQFIADAMGQSVDHALRARGGITDVLSRAAGPIGHLGMRLDFSLPHGATGHYAFRIRARVGGGFAIQAEECVIETAGAGQLPAYFRVRDGALDTNVGPLLLDAPDAILTSNLFLSGALALPREFEVLRDTLASMKIYNVNPERFRGLDSSNNSDALDRDGRNIAAVWARLTIQREPALQRIEDYLRLMTPSVRGVRIRYIIADGAPYATLEFLPQGDDPTPFPATSVSNGTLRALGILVALFQMADTGRTMSLIGVEEPELYIHPGATGVLLDALREASQSGQVLVTTHSPDLLDSKDIDASAILAVQSDERGLSQIAPLIEAERTVMRKHLYTAGELLRSNQTQPDPALLPARSNGHIALFGE